MGQHHSSHSHEVCPVHSLTESMFKPEGNSTTALLTIVDASKPIFGNTSFYQFNKILSGSCAAFASLAVITLMVMHATHLSKPNEQIKLVKSHLER